MENDRLSAVRSRMAAAGLTQLLITDSKNIRWLTGIVIHSGERFGGLLITPDDVFLYANVLFYLPDCPVRVVWHTDASDLAGIIALHLDVNATLGVDRNMPARVLLPLMEHLAVPPVLGSGCVDWCRALKSDEELAIMTEASRINDAVMLAAEGFIREGVTELEVAEKITAEYLKHGCSGVSFPPIVSFGANAADPHHEPDDTVIKPGDCIVLDIGGRYNGYCSDMTRTYFYKYAPEKYAAIHDLVREANEKAESIIKPGVPLCDIDAAARRPIAAAGYGDNFTHRLGHFIGEGVHEYGDVSASFAKEVEPGMVFSIEPGVYLEGEFGVRVEDLVIVTDSGCRVLNAVPKKWRVLG